MLRRASRKDANQSLIVEALRGVGVKVYILNEPVDLATLWRGVARFIEIKDGDKYPSQRKLKRSQEKFFREWADGPVFKVETIAEAFSVHGIEVSA